MVANQNQIRKDLKHLQKSSSWGRKKILFERTTGFHVFNMTTEAENMDQFHQLEKILPAKNFFLSGQNNLLSSCVMRKNEEKKQDKFNNIGQ